MDYSNYTNTETYAEQLARIKRERENFQAISKPSDLTVQEAIRSNIKIPVPDS